MSDPEPFLEMRGIRKEFPGVVANDDVDMAVGRGEIHGLLGENGAGKSTLMKILYGLYSPTAGEVWLDGRRLDLESPQDAIDHGIGMVHQHFMLIPRLSVVKNVVLGEREPAARFRGVGGLRERLGRLFSLGLAEPRERVRDLAAEYGLSVDPDAKVWELDIGEQQRVEILKALYRDVDLLILDEPTAVLTPTEAERMFETLRKLADQGLSIIFITHKLSEIEAVTDRVTVLRKGGMVDTVETAAHDRADFARMMVGRDVLFDLEKEPVDAGEPVLEGRGLRARDSRDIEVVSDVDVEVDAGEVVGVAGVSGNGQKELAECLVGVREVTDGTITVGGEDLTGKHPRAFIDAGVSFIPEDRHGYGCAPDLSVMHNAAMKDYRTGRFTENGVVDYEAMREYAEELVAEYDIRGVSDVAETKAGDLSGGNLQKLILAREIHRDPAVIVANQPTRGVDVGAIESIRKVLLRQRAEGTGILLISEDLDEVFDMADRILVIYEGELVMETRPGETDHETVGLAMTGGDGTSPAPAAPETAADGDGTAADGGRVTEAGDDGTGPGVVEEGEGRR